MKVFRLKLLLVCTIVLLVGAGSVALGDWNTDDGHKMHYPQLPDLSDNGMDVLAGPFSVDAEGTIYYEKFLADDFLCTESGPITGIHIWCSYRDDTRFMVPPVLSLVIYDNVPAGTGGIDYSRPGDALWDTYVQPTVELVYATDLDEDFYDPNPDEIVGSDTMLWQYNFEFDAVDAFPQERDQIYWLGVHHTFDLNGDLMVNLTDLMILKQYWPGCLGWKTSGVQQYEDDAVWAEVDTWGALHPHVVPEGEIWSPLDYPVGHPYEDVSIDLAFVITGPEQVELDFGDSPRPYPTLLAVDGARHIIGGPYFCEVGGLDSPDPEGDGQPHLNALGDDLDGNDDEDGVQVPLLTAGMPANISLMVCGSAPGGGAMVEIWIDWHSDGSWDASDMAFAGALGDGPALVPVLPPANSVNGPTFARCRISTLGGLSPTGQASDGEVEDHRVYIEGGVKRPVPHLKWSQPPIPMDPNEDFPTYCGWDEPSYRDWVETSEPFWFDCWDCRTQCYGDADCDGDVDNDDEAIMMMAWMSMWPDLMYNPCADFDHDLTVGLIDQAILGDNMDTEPDPNCPLRPESSQMVADDFRCLGTMPIESIHWWGSHVGWDNPEVMPPMLPIGWRIGFWSNDASTQRCDFLYGAATGQPSGNQPSSLYKIDPSTGVATLIGPIGFNGVTGLSFAPDGTLYGTCHDAVTNQALLITIDRTTGAGTLVGPVGTIGTGQGRVPDISFRSNGVLYGYGHNPDQLITINTATGQGTVVGATGYSGNGNGMDFAPNGTLYATPSDNQSLVIINPATGVGSDVAGTVGSVPYRINALEFCQQHGVLFGSWNDSALPGSGLWYLVTLDLLTGLPTVIGPTVSGLDALAFHEISQPKELLKVIEVDAVRVTVDQVGWDYYYGYYPSDICYQYYVDLEPEEVFWQNKYLDRTEDKIFWLSITAIYDPGVTMVEYPWGWKTRPWSWMDDAVRFWLDGAPEPGLVLDPEEDEFIEPIEDPEFHESFDVAFELDTDPNYIKWEQPFTDIRLWPHFWDEFSMGWEDHWIEEKWRQDPDPIGWDVAFEDLDGNLVELADDWQCDETGPIDDIHFWTSYESDWWGPINQITVRIYTDDPCDPAIPGDYSEPNELKWERTFRPGEFIETWYDSGDQGFFEPVSGEWEPQNHQEYYLVDIDDINDPFIQEQGNIYWLSIEANSVDSWVGWKTSSQQWNDDAVYKDPSTGEWFELYDPERGTSLDLAFVLTTKEEELYIDRLVADDWPCDYNTPITATVWWGSYIGYGYEACQDQGMGWMPLPVKPDYFWLTIWDDVPDPNPFDPTDYSHPNDIIWEYKAYDYDEVLVGYDKFPHDGDDDPNEPVFRYSVRLPHDEWFLQEEPNDIYWFSVLAVYGQHIPNYLWGWTNHKHVYNDDAVEGYPTTGPDNGPSEWDWYELFDQTQKSEDMSFILFTDPAGYTCWDPLECAGQTTGDATCDGQVNLDDLAALKAAWGMSSVYANPFCCADFTQDGQVNLDDLAALKAGWGGTGLIPSTGSQKCPP